MKVLMCGPLARSGGVSTHTKNICRDLEALGVQVILYDFHGSSFMKMYRRTLGLLGVIIKGRSDYEVIHIQTSGGLTSFISAVAGSFGASLVKKPLICTFHYSQTASFLARYPRLFGYVLRHCRKMIVVSHLQKTHIGQRYPSEAQKVAMVPNGFRGEVFFPRDRDECRRQLDVPVDKKILFNISNIIPTKGHSYLIEAMDRVRKEHPNIICYIAGRGPLLAEYEQEVHARGLDEQVHFLGWIPDEMIPLWIGASDLCVLPSLAEGNPIVMFEALGCARPFLGTRVGGIPEIIHSEQYGLLCDPGDVACLVEKIISGCTRNWDHAQIGAYANQFRWDTIARETYAMYQDVSG
jgi:teichuronic acid biosynthesis glycosyltransferase TuaC